MHSVSVAAALTPAEVDEVLALCRAAGDTDGAYPLSEHVVLHLRAGSPAHHVLIRRLDDHGGRDVDHSGRTVDDGDRPTTPLEGYAYVDVSDLVDGPSAELVVHPMHRRRGNGHRLISAAVDIAEQHDQQGRLRLWAHGDHPSAGALAIRLGFGRHRSLWQMRRSLFAPIDTPVLPEGVTIRAFEPGKDDDEWLAVNARAFATHPEQGRWARADLQRRMDEPWFDPAGFLLAVRGNKILGYHWTKIHRDGHEPLGEVYVLGIDPVAQHMGLASGLTLAGLRYLRGQGLSQVTLYVDEDNPKAVRLYEKHGFARWSVDVNFKRVTHI